MALVFDVYADMAMFRKPYTTTSQVSFPFPPPTAVAGLLGAIVGLDHQAAGKPQNAAFWEQMAGTRVAIGMRKPLRWFSTAINLLFFKSPNGSLDEHIQSKHQFVKAPGYRVYISGGTIYPELKRRLERKEFVFTPYLGVAYALAEVVYVGEYEEYPVVDQKTWVDTIVPLYSEVKPDVAKGAIHKETVPMQMTSTRQIISTVEVFYPEVQASGRLWLLDRGATRVTQMGEERVAWFDAW